MLLCWPDLVGLFAKGTKQLGNKMQIETIVASKQVHTRQALCLPATLSDSTHNKQTRDDRRRATVTSSAAQRRDRLGRVRVCVLFWDRNVAAATKIKHLAAAKRSARPNGYRQ